MSDVTDFIEAIDDDRRREEARRLDGIFRDVTGFEARMWGKLIGYGSYDYTYESGRSGTSFATGFGTSKARLSLHIMPGYHDFTEILERLGKHKTGAACVYITRLETADETALRDLISAGLDRLSTIWPVQPS